MSIMKKEELQTLINNTSANEVDGCPNIIEPNGEICVSWPKRRKPCKGVVQKISKSEKFLESLAKKDKERQERQAEAQDKAQKPVGKKGAAASKASAEASALKKAVVSASLQSDAGILKKIAEATSSPSIPNVSNRSSSSTSDSMPPSGSVCACPGCPFVEYKKGLAAMSIGMEILDQAKSNFAAAFKALTALQETTVSPPPVPDKTKDETAFSFPDAWSWQKPELGTTPLMIASRDEKGKDVLRNSGIYLNEEKLKTLTTLNVKKPNKMVTALYKELFGDKLMNMTYGQIPEKARNVIYAYVMLNKEKEAELKDYRKTVNNLCYAGKPKESGVTREAGSSKKESRKPCKDAEKCVEDINVQAEGLPKDVLVKSPKKRAKISNEDMQLEKPPQIWSPYFTDDGRTILESPSGLPGNNAFLEDCSFNSIMSMSNHNISSMSPATDLEDCNPMPMEVTSSSSGHQPCQYLGPSGLSGMATSSRGAVETMSPVFPMSNVDQLKHLQHVFGQVLAAS